ncbi:MAG TPA: NAD(P)/FAD-dependent oxidoreductase [Bryobacteraceae bacterium]|jgi:phytoene dehydrogenase-like protein|nr:NAD(P)/FAD-dependent oxidoreductase [Bryobacteraceae bacterium]
MHTIFGRPYPVNYDAIIIGSGIGGLFCGNILAKAGLKVLLLERHYMLGGFCSTFRRRGFIFDAATHFYPLLGNPTTLTGKLLQELEIPTEWVKMDPVDQFHLPNMQSFAVPADFGEFLAKLKGVFPEEAVNIEAYFDELRQAYLYGLLYYFKGVDNERARKFEQFSVTGKLDQHFRDPRLKALLMADTPHWGSLPDRTSYLFDAMLRLAYFLGNYYPKGSSQKFADDLGRGLEARGGRILKCASVDKILIENNQAEGVRISTVSKRAPEYFEFRAPIVISNADALHTYQNLIGEEHCGRWPIERLKSLKPSYPCFLTHLGLRGMDPRALAESEGYYWTCYDPVDAIRNVFKIFIPTHFDPSIAPPGCQILIVQKLTPVRIEQISDWPAHKAAVEEQIMTRLRQILPGIDAHIVVKLSATAMTSNRFTNNWQGAMLGWEMSPDQLAEGRLPNSTTVKNLHLVGHWTQPGGGITPVIVSAQRVARTILTGKQDTRDLAADYFAFRSGKTAGAEAVAHRVRL